MSTVVRPSGPLPTRVYWLRRLVLALVLVTLVALVWWFLVRGDDTDGDTAGAAAQASASGDGSGRRTEANRGQQARSNPEAEERPVPSGDGNDRSQAAEGQSAAPGSPGTGLDAPGEEPLLQPSGDCDPTDVDIAIVVDDTTEGRGMSARLRLTSEAEPACTLAITADSLALRVTSGSDTVWTSQECPDSVSSRRVVVRQKPATVYTFDWDGKRSVVNCQSPGEVAGAGGYWLEAALVGAGVERAYFDIT